MADTNDLIKDEFTQNYLQYRWLDDTRTRLFDRFFILTVAVLIARLQFGEYLTDNWGWLLVFYSLYIIIAVSFSRSITIFRRQQRCHGNYINCLRSAIMKNINQPEKSEFKDVNSKLALEYERYVKGRGHFLTKWIEFSIIIIASLSLFSFLDILIGTNKFPSDLALFISPYRL